MTEISIGLQSEGWYLKESAITEIRSFTSKTQGAGLGKVVSQALNRDLSEIGQKYIQDRVSSGKDATLSGPCVLQVSKVRNVSAPKENEHSNFAPRMLKIVLTDGCSTVNAIEYEKIDQLSLNTAPGTKVKLIGSIPLASGILQLHAGCVKVLGGKVEKLYTKWKINCDAGGLTREGISTDGGPPPFVAFGKRVATFNQYKKGIKPLTVPNDDDKENSEFNEQRKAAIAGASKNSVDTHTFPGDTRSKFGKIPDAGGGCKKPISANQHHQFDRSYGAAPVRSSTGPGPLPPKSTGIYRELSTDSGENVHQKTVAEFVSMGFKHEDVVLCLRKSNNDFEMAMDMLCMSSENQTQTQGSDNRRGWSNDRRGNRAPRGGRRGRGRGRPAVEEPQSQGANQATLFDFLESKISNAANPEAPENYNETDDDFQKSYRNNSRYSERQIQSNTRDGYRGGGRSNNFRTDQPRHETYKGRRQHGNEEYSRQSKNFNDTRSPYHESNNRSGENKRQERQPPVIRGNDWGQPNHYQNENSRPQSGENRNRRSENRPYGNKDAGNSRQQHDRFYQQPSRPPRQNHGPPRKGMNNASRGGGLPPRFTKGGGNEASNQRKQEQSNKEPQQNKSPVENSPPPGFDLVSVNPPPAQRGPTTFGQAPQEANNEIREETHQPFHHASSLPRNQFSSQQVHVMLPQWLSGMECMAKYWEDGQYYKAVIANLHPTVPTAVVQFLGFGNYEEVRIIDLKPVSNPSFQDTGPPAVGIQQGPQAFDNRQRTVHRPGRPAIALYIPPQSRGSS